MQYKNLACRGLITFFWEQQTAKGPVGGAIFLLSTFLMHTSPMQSNIKKHVCEHVLKPEIIFFTSKTAFEQSGSTATYCSTHAKLACVNYW